MQRRTNEFSNVNYCRVRTNDDFTDEQFLAAPAKVPVKSLCFAFFLLTCGTALLVTSFLQLTGYIHEKYADRTWPVLIMGSIMFLPGAYYSRIALLAYYRYPGFSYDDIPEFN